MAEGRMAEIVGQRHRLGQILVEPQRAGERTGDLRHLDRMGQAGAVVVALVVEEDLRLVLQAAERGRMDDAVAIALERGAGRARRLRDQAGRGSAQGFDGIGRARAAPPKPILSVTSWQRSTSRGN